MEQVNFLATDGVNLNGFLYSNNNKNIILSVHGMSSNCFKKREITIANSALENGIDYFCFNNRGSELVKYVKKKCNNKKIKIVAGSAFEDATDGYYDIVGSILKLKELGYSNIYLQGHSLGCTKILYTFKRLKKENSELLNNIKGLILLSLVDINRVFKAYLEDKYEYYLNLAEEKEKQGKFEYLMPKESFIHPVSVKTYLKYLRDYEEIDVDNYNIVSIIDIPVFMRWGTYKEMILQKPDELANMVNEKIKHKNKDINYIDGANHSYNDYEKELAEQIIDFVKKYSE